MEVPGRRLSSSDDVKSIEPETRKLLCDPCLEDGQRLLANGYCVDCEHYLCTSCFHTHLKPKPSRHHQLLDTQKMPTSKKPEKVYKDECTNKCETHKDEIVKYWCENHKGFGCSVCMTLKHRNCDVGYMPTLSHVFESEEYGQFKSTVEELSGRIKTTLNTATRNLTDIETQTNATVKQVREFRQKVNDFFDKLENEVLDKLKQIQEENQRNIEDILNSCETMQTKLRKIEKDINDNETKGQKNRMFIDMQQLRKTIKNHQHDADKLERDNKVRPTLFTPSQHISDFIRDSSQDFGSLLNFHKTLPIHMDTGESCEITGIAALPNGRIVVSDFSNKCVHVLDTIPGTTTMSQDMSECTYGIAAVSDNEIAVTQDGNIELYSVGENVELKRRIKNADLEYAPVYTHNAFIGCTKSKPHKVRMVNMGGKVIKKYPPTHGKYLFEDPWYIVSNSDHTVIYVSDLGNNTVTSLSIEGEVKARTKNDAIWWPRGVAVSRDGLVYVNDERNSVIHILTADLKKVGLIDGEPHGITRPWGLAYCPKEQKLYVGMAGSREIVVLNV